MPYSASWVPGNPGSLLVLLDVSKTMDDPWGGAGATRIGQVTDLLNGILADLLERCRVDDGLHQFRCEVQAYAYGGKDQGVAQLLPTPAGKDLVPTTALPQMAKRVVERRSRANGEVVEVDRDVFFEPKVGGMTPMKAAFQKAATVAARCIASAEKDRREPHPPIVLNVTDGYPTDARDGADLVAAAAAITRLGRPGEHPLLFNVHIGDGTPVLFADDDRGLPSKEARDLFAASSVLPEETRKRAAAKLGLAPLPPGARAYAYNADFETLWALVSFGTSLDEHFAPVGELAPPSSG